MSDDTDRLAKRVLLLERELGRARVRINELEQDMKRAEFLFKQIQRVLLGVPRFIAQEPPRG